MQPAYSGCGAAFTKEMKTCFLLFLAERTQWVINTPHYSKMSTEGVMSGKEIYQCSKIPTTSINIMLG